MISKSCCQGCFKNPMGCLVDTCVCVCVFAGHQGGGMGKAESEVRRQPCVPGAVYGPCLVSPGLLLI